MEQTCPLPRVTAGPRGVCRGCSGPGWDMGQCSGRPSHTHTAGGAPPAQRVQAAARPSPSVGAQTPVWSEGHPGRQGRLQRLGAQLGLHGPPARGNSETGPGRETSAPPSPARARGQCVLPGSCVASERELDPGGAIPPHHPTSRRAQEDGEVAAEGPRETCTRPREPQALACSELRRGRATLGRKLLPGLMPSPLEAFP